MSEKKTEDEWFARHEVELLRQARRERERQQREQESQDAARRRELHWMKCPKCGSDLAEEQASGVSVDRCASCGGIFLDRGELETVLLKDKEARRGFFRKLAGILD